MINHSPGEWKFDGHGINADGERIATMDDNHYPFMPRCPMLDADGFVMAASKELHAALTHCLDALYNETHGQDDSPWIKEVKAMSHKALEKARGTQVDGPYVGSLGCNERMLNALKQALHHVRNIPAAYDQVGVPKAFAICAIADGLKSAGITNLGDID